MPAGLRTAFRELLQVSGWLVFLLVVMLYLCMGVYTLLFVYTDAAYFQTLQEQLEWERIRDFVEVQAKMRWVGLALSPVFLAVKVGFTALCLSIGAVVAEHEQVSVARMFKAALVCELIFFAAAVLNLAWVLGVVGMETLNDLSYHYPLSLLQLLGAEAVPSWLLHAARTVNLFEVAYAVALAAAVAHQSRCRLRRVMPFVGVSYGLGLLLWVSVVAFINLQLG